jgi:hypothetical protein
VNHLFVMRAAGDPAPPSRAASAAAAADAGEAADDGAPATAAAAAAPARRPFTAASASTTYLMATQRCAIKDLIPPPALLQFSGRDRTATAAWCETLLRRAQKYDDPDEDKIDHAAAFFEVDFPAVNWHAAFGKQHTSFKAFVDALALRFEDETREARAYVAVSR